MTSSHPSDFASTQWTRIFAAATPEDPGRREALIELCERYWYPLYAFLRRKSIDADLAQDYVQGFFAEILERDFLQKADPLRGRFRSFLLSSISNYLANCQRHDRAQKRGGAVRNVPLEFDFAGGERRYQIEPQTDETPEVLFQRRWALEQLDKAIKLVAEQYQRRGKSQQFERLKHLLTEEPTDGQYAALASEMKMTNGALKVAVFRLRSRYREALREVIARTVEHPDQIDQEIQELLSALLPSS